MASNTPSRAQAATNRSAHDCETEVVPLDAALGLEPRTEHTLGVRERGLWLVTELSYQRSVDVAAELRH